MTLLQQTARPTVISKARNRNIKRSKKWQSVKHTFFIRKVINEVSSEFSNATIYVPRTVPSRDALIFLLSVIYDHTRLLLYWRKRFLWSVGEAWTVFYFSFVSAVALLAVTFRKLCRTNRWLWNDAGETKKKLCAIYFLCVSERLRFLGKTGTGTTAAKSVKSSNRSDSKTFNQTFPIRNVISTILTFCEKVFRNPFWFCFFHCLKINLKKYFWDRKVLLG